MCETWLRVQTYPKPGIYELNFVLTKTRTLTRVSRNISTKLDFQMPMEHIIFHLCGCLMENSLSQLVTRMILPYRSGIHQHGCRLVGCGRAILRLSSQLPWTLLVPFSHPHLKTTRFAFGAFWINKLLPYSSTTMRCFVSPSPQMASTFSAEERMQWSQSGQYLHWRTFLRTRNQMRVLFIFRPSFISFSSRLCCGRMPRRNKWQIMWVPILFLSSRILILNLDAKAQQSDCDACFQPSLFPCWSGSSSFSEYAKCSGGMIIVSTLSHWMAHSAD